MPDVLAIRTNEETQARFKTFAEAGDFRNQSEFLEHLLTLHAAQEISIQTPILESAISAVGELTERITKILIGAGEVIFTSQEKDKARIEAIQQETNARIETINIKNQIKITSLSDENERFKAAIEDNKIISEATQNKLTEALEREKKHEKTINDKEALIESYKEKITNLENEIKILKDTVTNAANAATELDILRIKCQEQDLQIKHIELEKDKALIELEIRLRNEMNAQQVEYSKELKAYESKVLSLLNER